MIAGEEVGQAVAGPVEQIHVGQIDNAEVVGVDPVEAAAVRDEDLLLLEQIESEKLVVMDVEFLHIHLRENVEGGVGLGDRNAGYGPEPVVNHLALLVDTASRNEKLLRLVPVGQSRSDD